MVVGKDLISNTSITQTSEEAYQSVIKALHAERGVYDLSFNIVSFPVLFCIRFRYFEVCITLHVYKVCGH